MIVKLLHIIENVMSPSLCYCDEFYTRIRGECNEQKCIINVRTCRPSGTKQCAVCLNSAPNSGDGIVNV